MKKILCALMIMLLPVMAYADFLGIKKADEYVVMQVEALNSAGLRALPDSVHVLTYLDQNDAALAFSSNNTSFPFAAIGIDTSKIFGDTTYWFSDQIQDIDGAPSPSTQYALSIDIVMWTGGLPTHNIATVQVIADSLQNYLDSTALSTAAAGADAVWDELVAAHTTALTYGDTLPLVVEAIKDTLENQDDWVAREASLFDWTSDDVAVVTLTNTATAVTNDVTLTDAEHGLISDSVWLHDTVGFTAVADFGHAVTHPNLDNATGTLDAAQFGADFLTAAKIADDAVDEISEKVWFNIDTLNVDSSKIGEWLVNNLAVAGALSAADIVAIADTIFKRDSSDVNAGAATSYGTLMMKPTYVQADVSALATAANLALVIDTVNATIDTLQRFTKPATDTLQGIIDSIQNLATLTDIQTIGSRTVVKRGIVKTLPAASGFSSTVLTESQDNYWIDNVIEMRTGVAIGQITRISDFTASTDSLTFSPVFEVAPAIGDSFYILANFEESPSAGSVTAADIVAIADTIFSRDSSDINAGAATSFGTLMAKEQYVTGFDPVNDAVANVTLTATTTAITNDVTLTDAEHGLISDSVWLHDTVGFTSVADFGHAVTHPNLDNATGTLSDAQIDNITVGALDATAVDDIMDADTNTADLASGFGRAIAEGARATLPANKLDITAGGNAGIDWNNVETPGATVALSATTVNLVTTTTTATNLTTNNDKTGYTLTDVQWENVWFNIDTTNVDSSKIGEWLVNNLAVAGALSAADIVAIADTIFKRDTSDVNAGDATSYGTIMTAPGFYGDAVWNELVSGHSTALSFGDSLIQSISGAGVIVTTNNDKTGYTLTAAGYVAGADTTLNRALGDTTTNSIFAKIMRDANAASATAQSIEGKVNQLLRAEIHITGAVTGGSPGLTGIGSTTQLAGFADDYWNNQVVVFVTGNAVGQSTRITDFTDATDSITFDAISVAPAAGDSFVIVVQYDAGGGSVSLGASDIIAIADTIFHRDSSDVNDGAATSFGTLLMKPTYVQGSAAGLDSQVVSNIVHRVGWGTAVGSGSDSSTLAERDVTVASMDADVITSSALASSAALEISDTTWDEILTGATHNIANSAGRRLREIEEGEIITQGTAQSGTATTIVLAAATSFADGILAGNRIVLTGGTGQGQTRHIETWTSTGDLVTLHPGNDWTVNPDVSTEYKVEPSAPADVSHISDSALSELWNFPLTTITSATGIGRTLRDTSSAVLTGQGVQRDTLSGIIDSLQNQDDWVAREASLFDNTTDSVIVDGSSLAATTDAITATTLAATAAAEIAGHSADSAWEELSSAHTTAATTGLALFGQAPITGVVAANGGNGSTSFDTDLAETTNDHFNGQIITFISGSEVAGQSRYIYDYNGTSKFISVAPALIATPSSGDIFVIQGMRGSFEPQTIANNTNRIDVNAAGNGAVSPDFSNISGTLDAAEIGTDAITDAKIATDAEVAIGLATWNTSALTAFTSGAMGDSAIGGINTWGQSGGGVSAADIVAIADTIYHRDSSDANDGAATSMGVLFAKEAYMSGSGGVSAADIVAIADTIFHRDSSDVNDGDATSYGTLLMKPAYVQGGASGLTASEIGDTLLGRVYDGDTLLGSVGALFNALATSQHIDSVKDSTINSATEFKTSLNETTNDHFNGQTIVFLTGVNANQSRLITDYVGGTQNYITVSSAFSAEPAAIAKFAILGQGMDIDLTSVAGADISFTYIAADTSAAPDTAVQGVSVSAYNLSDQRVATGTTDGNGQIIFGFKLNDTIYFNASQPIGYTWEQRDTSFAVQNGGLDTTKGNKFNPTGPVAGKAATVSVFVFNNDRTPAENVAVSAYLSRSNVVDSAGFPVYNQTQTVYTDADGLATFTCIWSSYMIPATKWYFSTSVPGPIKKKITIPRQATVTLDLR